MTMLSKIKEYAKGVAAAVSLAGTVVVEGLPIDSAARLYAGIGVAIAGLVTVVVIPNTDPDKAAKTETAVAELGTAVVKIVPDAAGFVAKLEQILGEFEGTVALKPVLSDTGPHDAVGAGVGSVPAPVVDAASDPVGDVPADPASVVADDQPAAASSVAPIPEPPLPPVDPPAAPAMATDPSAGAAPVETPAPADATPSGLDDGVTLPDDVPPPTVGILTS